VSNQYDRRRLNVKGGGLLQLRQIDPTPGSFLTVGFIADSKFADDPNMVEEVDEAGRFIDVVSAGSKPKFTSNLMQSSSDEINLVRLAGTLYYELYYYVALANGRFQELNAPICRVVPKLDLSFKAGEKRVVPIEISFLAAALALTRTPTAYNVAQWGSYVLIEGAAASGAPSDAGTVPQAAI